MSLMSEEVKEPIVRSIPYPYRAMLAICSDLDETPDRLVYWEIMRFLNTTEETAMGPGEELEKKVFLLGRLNTEEVHKELSAAGVFALTSLEENSPMGIEEVMAVGVPVVASNRCGMPYMVRDGESGFLVDPNNLDDIARRLGQLLKNDELRQSMGAKGREIAWDRFHPAKVAARTLEVYLRAVQDFEQK